jgi:hypothetical protein
MRRDNQDNGEMSSKHQSLQWHALLHFIPNVSILIISNQLPATRYHQGALTFNQESLQTEISSE